MTSSVRRLVATLVHVFLSAVALQYCQGAVVQEVTPHLTSQQRCVDSNRTYAPGETYRVDACTTCHCPRHVTSSTRPHCTVQDCLPSSNCFRFDDADRSDASCCPTCVEYGCLHNGTVYAGGQVNTRPVIDGRRCRVVCRVNSTVTSIRLRAF